jgi:hypothetical protein
VKLIKDKTGRFHRRLWFEDGEIELLSAKHLEEYLRTNKKATNEDQTVDEFIEIYLPKAVKKNIVFDPYADLVRSEGSDVLGATYFCKDCVEVKIERTLTIEAERLDQWGRYNATVIHEAGHCIIHSVLFESDPRQQVLFSGAGPKKITCLQRNIEGYRTGEWWEFQANQFMANFLMPKEFFLNTFFIERNAYGIRDNKDLVKDEHLFKAVVGYLSRVFHVSKQAVKIRLYELKQVSSVQQEEFSYGAFTQKSWR